LFLAGITLGLSYLLYYRFFRHSLSIDSAVLSRYRPLIDELAETIIPRTETPGARDVGVGKFIEEMVIHCVGSKEQRNFVDGLKSLEAYSNRHFSNSFVHCSETEKQEILAVFEKKSQFSHHLISKVYYKLLGVPFYQVLKWLAVEGYCTSERGATEGLAYDPIPVHYLSCVPLMTEQRSWATK